MARGYQRLEELDEKAQPAGKDHATGKTERAGKAPTFASLIVIALLVVALGGALLYAARMREHADAEKALAENAKREMVVVHQQAKMLEGERDSLETRVNALTSQLKKAEDEKNQLLGEIENLKKARAVPQKQGTGKSRKRA